MTKQQLASKIWESANKMRSKIEANEYKDYILGFIFYKFLSDKEVDYLVTKDKCTEDDIKALTETDSDMVKYCQDKFGYFIAYENLFSTWLKMGSDFNVSNVRDALSAFSRLINPGHKNVFEGIFKTLETGLGKLGENSGTQTKAVRDLLYLIKDIPMDGKQDYDVLGFIYEYLISMFAANAGKKAGEFYTPHEVSLLMSEIVAEHLNGRDKIEIYDPTSGSGSLLINIGKSVAKRMNTKNNVKYYAQELKENTYNLTRMNLVMRGIIPANICVRNADTLDEDWPIDPNSPDCLLPVDAVVSNPPYSQTWDPTDKDNDKRYKDYGVAPKTKADYAFLLHDLYHIKQDGIMAIVLPHGVLFRGGDEEKIRTKLIEKNKIDAIIGLPANIFFGTGIPTIIMILRQHRDNTDVLIIDASKGFEKVGKNNKLRASDIKKIVDTFTARADIPKYSRKVSRELIRENGYNLNIPRYVDSSEKSESWDIYASIFGGIPQSEIDELKDFWTAFPTLQTEIFKSSDIPYSAVAVDDVINAISNNADVKGFKTKFKNAFAGFEQYLNTELIENSATVAVATQEPKIAEQIFKRLDNIPLIDKYTAYQLLDDAWTKISNDLEIIQIEGFAATKQVDPNYVTKKDAGKDTDVQNGWVGHVVPFELVQTTYLKEEYDILKEREGRLSEIDSETSETFESFTDDEKEDFSTLFNDDKNAVVPAEISKQAKIFKKQIKTLADDSVERRVIRLSDLTDESRQVKKEIKDRSDKLQNKTKTTIENLTDEQAKEMLNLKWVKPLCDAISILPDSIVSTLESRINALTKKYSVTMLDVESQIEEAEGAFSTLIDDLTGSDFDMKGLKELQKILKGE